MRQELINKLHEAAKQCQSECISGDIAVGNTDVPYIFIEGAKWIIENLWHTPSEPRDMKRSVIVRLINGHYGFWKGSFTDGKIEKQFNLYSATQVGETAKGIVEKWCYLDDIVPGTY